MNKRVQRGRGQAVKQKLAYSRHKALKIDGESVGLGTAISQLFRKVGLDGDIPELGTNQIAPGDYALQRGHSKTS